MMKILIVDDHALVRRGLHYVVKEGFPDAEVTEAESAAAALEHIHNGKEIDLALVDVRMPDLDGLELLRALKTDRPDMPVVMLSTYDNAPYVKRALADGASGYLLKDATPEDLSQAINVALSGQWERPVAAGDPEPLRGARVRGARPRTDAAASSTSRSESTTSSSSSPRGRPTARSRDASTCRRRPSRPTSPRSSASSASPTGHRPR